MAELGGLSPTESSLVRSVSAKAGLVPRGKAGADHRLLLWGLLALTLYRLVIAGIAPLTEDEAYYRLWAGRLQFGYYDHPPMIAWWIAIGRLIVGDDPLGVRLLPVLGGTLTTLLLYDSARLAGASERVAVRAALWFNATLLIGIGVILAVPDAPSTLFWMASLWGLLRARASGRPLWWIAAGVAAGLATLSKYSALFLAPGVFLWLVCGPKGRAELRRPWPWITAAVAAGFFALNVAWNAEHEWVAFIKQFGRVVPGPPTLRFVGELVVGQFALLNPLIAVFAWRPFDLRRYKTWPADTGLFIATVAPFLIYLLLHSLHASVYAHWAAPLYPGLAFLAAVAAETVRPRSLGQMVRRAAAPLGLTLSLAVLAYVAAGLNLLGRRDPALEIMDWPAFARAVEAQREATDAAWIGTLSYGVAAQLAARPEIRAPVLQLDQRDRYVFLPPSGADLAQPGLVVDLVRRGKDKNRILPDCFDNVQPLATLQRGPFATVQTLYSTWHVAGPRQLVEDGCTP